MLYPQQNDLRNTLDLSGLWDFKLDPDEVGEAEGWFDGLAAPRAIAVPGSWNEQFQDTRDYLGAAWYLRRVYFPAAWQDQRIFVRVGSANYAAKLWLNGQPVGAHEGGHLPFACELTEQIRWGAANVLAIRVDNHLTPTRVPPGNVGGSGAMQSFMSGYPNTSFDFFPYAGLHRPVVLVAMPQRHIRDVTVVTDIDGAAGRVQVTVQQSHDAGSGRLVLHGAEEPISADLTFNGSTAAATLTVPQARFWSPDDPYLYPLVVTLTDDGKPVDRYEVEVGIRTIEVQGDQLLLNGQPIFLKGFGKHEDFPINGRGLNLPLVVKDYALLDWLGANSYRTAHYPYAEEAMIMANREGVLIVDEIPAVGLYFDDGPEGIQARLDQCKQQLQELIARDKNYPSVIMWSVANEPFPPDFIKRFTGGGGDSAVDADTVDFFRQLFALTRNLDPTRPATLAGIMGCPPEWLALSDVVFINRYWGWYTQAGQIAAGAKHLEAELDQLYEQLGKPIVVSEFGADTVAGTHADPPEMFSEEYQVEFLRAYLDVADRKKFVVGMHVWNFADFKTGQSTRRVNGLNLKGVFTRDRRPKMAAHFLRKRWRKA